MKYSIQEIADILNIDSQNLNNATISLLLTDSRQAFFPGEALFFALVTPNNDGHKYIRDLYSLNVRNFVVDRILPEWENLKGANFLCVKDTLDALQKIATFHRQKFNVPVIAVTGSNGKTIVKEWLYHVLHENFKITRSPRSYNSQIGVPLSIWQMDENTELGIFEAGISKCEEMCRLESIIRPSIGIITNIGLAHQEGFVSLQQKCLEKLELFIHCDVIICEEENRLIDECMEMACLSHKRLTWSRKSSPKSPLHILKIEKNTFSTTIHYSILGFTSQVTLQLTSDASIENAIHVIATAIYLHVPFEDINERMKSLAPIAMRLDSRSARNNCTVVSDTYNSDINSLNIALDFLNQRATDLKCKKALILSDIPLSGQNEEEMYKLASEYVRKHKIDLLIGIGEAINKNKDLFTDVEKHFFIRTHDFIRSNLFKNLHDMFILLKGARKFSFENILRLLEVKSHETVLDVDLNAIVHNYNFFKAKLNPSTKIMAMVKADAYGAGAVEIAKTLQYHKCDYLAVAVASEGVLLRKEGIRLPIVVLNPELSEFEELATYMLEPEIYNFNILERYIHNANKMGITNYPIHIKIDTGMHRLGFTQDDLPKLIDLIQNHSSVRIQSVFSHLAASEDPHFDKFTIQQIHQFKAISRQLTEAFDHTIIRHILNSGGIERFADCQMDMVRLGISLYGVSASGITGLQNACTLKTTILQIKEIKAGETVGYGRSGEINKDTRIATIRIGYADGFSRHNGNGTGFCLVNGKKVPVVGNVCMDLTMIDVTETEAKIGDTVIIFGNELPVKELAERTGSISHEVLASISGRVKRIYFKE